MAAKKIVQAPAQTEAKAKKKDTTTRTITIDVPATYDLQPYTLGNGRTILVFEAVKRKGKKAKPCCAYCERGFHQAPAKPLNAERLGKLAERKAKKIESTAGDIRSAIKMLKRTDQQAKRAVKTDVEYLQEILENASLKQHQLDQVG